MVMISYFKFGSVLLCLILLLSGCRTLQVPDFDSIKFPKFREEAEHIGDYPEVGEAPLTPDDLKSDREWDKAANRMLKTHASLETPKDYSGKKSPEEIRREIEILNAEAQEYKLDDPQ